MPRRSSKRPPSKSPLTKGQQFTEGNFRPYVTAIGRLALAWNALHEELARIFVRLMGGAEDARRSLAIWHAAQFDRPKRAMLKAVVQIEQITKRHPHADKMEDIIWILNKADTLEDVRNDAVHSPLLILQASTLAIYSGVVGKIIPDILHENPRAKKLQKKDDILSDFHWCRKATLLLRDFADEIEYALMTGQAWPERPSWPTRQEKRKPPTGQPHVPKG